MNLDTLTLECFITTAETGSFTKAAERVHRTQSAVSQQIAKLENFLGKSLFQRGKQLTLTTDGELFLGYARKMFTLHKEAIDRFKEPDLSGEVRFGLPEDFASVFLSDVLTNFVEIHPHILVNMECDLTLHLLDRFKKKELDLVLVKMSQPQDFPNGTEVWSEKLEWVGSPQILEKLQANEMALPLVLSPQPCVYRASSLKALEEKNIPWRIVFSSPSYAGTIAAVKAGLGITVLPHNMIPAELTAIKLPQLPSLKDTHISLLKQDQNNPAVNSFEKFVLLKLKGEISCQIC